MYLLGTRGVPTRSEFQPRSNDGSTENMNKQYIYNLHLDTNHDGDVGLATNYHIDISRKK